MNEIDVDSEKLKEHGNNIKLLSKNLIEQLEGLFDKLTTMDKFCWVGNSANSYIALAKNDKIKVMNFVSKLAEEGELMIEVANMLENNFKDIEERYR